MTTDLDEGLPPDLLQANHRRYNGADVGPSQLRQLILTLRAAGVEPTGAERYLALISAVPAPTPQASGRLLDLEPSALLRLATEQAVDQLSRDIAAERLADLQRQVTAEMIIDCRAEADSYIDQMRPAFDQAAGYAATLVKLGVSSADKAEFIARRGGKAVGAWLAFADHHVKTLDLIATARIRLSLVLGVAPASYVDGERVDFGVCFGTAAPRDLFSRRSHLNGWQRWLAIAESTELRLLTLDDVQQAQRDAWDSSPLVVEDADGGLRVAR